MARKILISILLIHIFTTVCFAGSISDYEENQAKKRKHYNEFAKEKIINNIFDAHTNYVPLNEFVRRIKTIKNESDQQQRQHNIVDLKKTLTHHVNELNSLKEYIKDLQITDELKEYPSMQNVPELLRTCVNELTLSQTQMLALINGRQVKGVDIRKHEYEAFKALYTIMTSFKEMSDKHKLELHDIYWAPLRVCYSSLKNSLESINYQ